VVSEATLDEVSPWKSVTEETFGFVGAKLITGWNSILSTSVSVTAVNESMVIVSLRSKLGRFCTKWTKTIQQDLKSSNLSLNETFDVTQNCLLLRLMSTFGATHL